MQRVAYVKRDERAERTQHKHGNGHRDKHKSQTGMGEDEFVSGKKILCQ